MLNNLVSSALGAAGSASGNASNRLFQENYNKIRNSAISKLGLGKLLSKIPTDTLEYQLHLKQMGDKDPIKSLKDNLLSEGKKFLTKELTALEGKLTSKVHNLLSFNVGGIFKKFDKPFVYVDRSNDEIGSDDTLESNLNDSKKQFSGNKLQFGNLFKINKEDNKPTSTDSLESKLQNKTANTIDKSNISTYMDFLKFFQENDIYDSNRFFINFIIPPSKNYKDIDNKFYNFENKTYNNIIKNINLPASWSFGNFHSEGSNADVITTNGNLKIIGDRLKADTTFSIDFIDMEQNTIIETLMIPWLDHINSDVWQYEDQPFKKINIEIFFPDNLMTRRVLTYGFENIYPIDISLRDKLQRKSSGEVSSRKVNFTFDNMYVEYNELNNIKYNY